MSKSIMVTYFFLKTKPSEKVSHLQGKPFLMFIHGQKKLP